MAYRESTAISGQMDSQVGPLHQDLQQWLERSSEGNQKSEAGRRGLAGRLFESTFRLLTSLKDVAQKSGSLTLADINQCQNEIERLFLWGDGFGAGDGNLDDILDQSSELKVNVLSLLSELGKLVSQNLFRSIDPPKPTIHEECEDLRMLLETAEAVLNEEGHQWRNSIAFSDSDISEGDFAEAIEDIASYTDCLMDLAPALEHPAIDVEFKEEVSKAETFQVSSTLAANYCRKIRDRFPHLDIRIVERLGEANEKRSQRLQVSYIEAEAAGIKGIQPEDTSELLLSKGEKYTETTKSTYVSESVFSTDQRAGISKEEYDDAASQTTFATFSTAFSTTRSGIPRVPPLPDSARSGRPFTCLACGKTLRTVRNRRIWKKHIFNDLQPYICTATTHTNEDCVSTFSSRSAWVKHETTHLRSEGEHYKCSFCPPAKATQPASTYFKHLSRHLREVALAVLPQSHESDSDSEAGSTSSKQALSEISSLRGSEFELQSVSRAGSRASHDSGTSNPLLNHPVPEVSNSDIIKGSSYLIDESEALGSEPFDKAKDAQGETDGPKEAAAKQSEAQPTIQPCRYKTGKTISAGSYTLVKECVHIDTGRYYAASIINKRFMEGREYSVRNEIAVLKRVSMGHQNLLTVVDYFETINNLYLVTDLALGGELFDRICRKGSYYERDVADIIKPVLSAIAYLHYHGVIHGDLKAENVLFKTMEDDADILITDFGSGNFLDGVTESEVYPEVSYAAPELLKGEFRKKPVDIWSIGVLTYFLLCGYTPFDRDSNVEERIAILEADFSFTPFEYWKGVSTTAREFIQQCLVINPAQRITADDALSHPWLQQPASPRKSTVRNLRATSTRQRLKGAIRVVIICNQLQAASLGIKIADAFGLRDRNAENLIRMEPSEVGNGYEDKFNLAKAYQNGGAGEPVALTADLLKRQRRRRVSSSSSSRSTNSSGSHKRNTSQYRPSDDRTTISRRSSDNIGDSRPEFKRSRERVAINRQTSNMDGDGKLNSEFDSPRTEARKRKIEIRPR